MRCVVTGVAGFIGSSLADKILQNGGEVIGIDCFIDYYPKEMKERNLEKARSFDNFTFHDSDLNSLDLAEVCAGVDYIFHQAAQAGVRASWGEQFSIYTDNNILASQRLLEACRSEQVKNSLKKLVYASSSSVYGNAQTLPTTEDLRPQPVSPYGVSKLAAEHLMGLYSQEFGVPTASLRYFTVYGPRHRPDMAFHRFLKAGLTDTSLTLFDDGEQSRDFTFIDDVLQANLDAAKYEGSELVFNIGGGSRVSMNQVIEIMESILGKSLKVERGPRQKGDVKHTGADTSRAKQGFGYSPKVSLEEGLKAEADWLEQVVLKSGS